MLSVQMHEMCVWDVSRWWDRAVHQRKKENNKCLLRSGTKISVTAQNCGLAAGDKNTLYSCRQTDHANNNKTTTWAKQLCLKMFIKDNMMRRYTQCPIDWWFSTGFDSGPRFDIIWRFSMMSHSLSMLASAKFGFYQMNFHHLGLTATT